MKLLKIGLLTLLGFILSGCSSSGIIPVITLNSSIGNYTIGGKTDNSSTTKYHGRFNISDACSIYRANPHWRKEVLKSSRKWGTPEHIFLSVIKQESGFKPNAQPLNKKGKPISSAYGISQALKGTWLTYQRNTGNHSHRRASFGDSVNFMGWYFHESHKQLRISKWDIENQYLAYHEGWGGFKKRNYRKKKWLMKVAAGLENQAWKYKQQLERC
jgi:hypothetical protein